MLIYAIYAPLCLFIIARRSLSFLNLENTMVGLCLLLWLRVELGPACRSCASQPQCHDGGEGTAVLVVC